MTMIEQSAKATAMEDFQVVPGGIYEGKIASWSEIAGEATERRMFALEDCGIEEPTDEQLKMWAVAYVAEYNRLHTERAR